MLPVLTRTARKQFTVRHVLTIIAFLALFYGFSHDFDLIIVLCIALAMGETVEILKKTPTVDNHWLEAGMGAFITLASLAWLALASTTGGQAWFPALTTLIGIWFLLDARKNVRTGRDPYPSEEAEMGMSEMMLVMTHVNLVADELKTGPKTIPELADACDLTESRVRESLDVPTSDGTIYRVDGHSPHKPDRYALDESKLGKFAFICLNSKRIARRLARPFRR